jgi:hypothetical protein
VIRGTALSAYPDLVSELGGDPEQLLRAAGIRLADIGRFDAFVPYLGLIQAVESAASITDTPDFGRRLGRRHGVEILGPVGVAARTSGLDISLRSLESGFRKEFGCTPMSTSASSVSKGPTTSRAQRKTAIVSITTGQIIAEQG